MASQLLVSLDRCPHWPEMFLRGGKQNTSSGRVVGDSEVIQLGIVRISPGKSASLQQIGRSLPARLSFDVPGWACSGGKFVVSGGRRSIRCASKRSKSQIPIKVVP